MKKMSETSNSSFNFAYLLVFAFYCFVFYSMPVDVATEPNYLSGPQRIAAGK